jgi:uracil-DNA glycosylase
MRAATAPSFELAYEPTTARVPICGDPRYILPMRTDRLAELRALLAFYAEAGVDTVLEEAPVNRFAAATSSPSSGPARPTSDPAVLQQPSAPDRPRVPDRPLDPPRRGSGVGGSAPLRPDAAIMAAREAASRAESLEKLRALLEGFEGCALRVTAKRLVFADGNPKARVMFVGEAPGRDEDLAGVPFVGVSGRLLDRMLATIGLDRSSVYIANLVPWRPPGNRPPTPQESQICLPFLKRQIELADPDILVCLGGPSATALLGMTDGIRKFRGRWRTYHTGSREIRAIASFHPSYLLRSPLEKRFAWRDFQAIRAALAA